MLHKLLNSSFSPFRSTPDVRFYFEHPSIESARQTVQRAMIRAEGPAAVMGGSGYGKSLLAELVADHLCQRMDVIILQSARLSSRRALLQSILFELKMPYRDLSEGELRLSILDRLEPSPETAPEGVLVIVDEAHTLHWKLIDELRLISNFTRNHQPRVKLLLLGNMKLEDTLTSPQLDSFNQRLAARCYLQPMNRSETCSYVQHQIRLCDVDPARIVTQDALQSVFSASEGIPRLVNQVMNHAIWMASNSAQLPISASLINDAWRDLQQLPTPWSAGQSDRGNSPASIEFAELSDDADESSESLELHTPSDRKQAESSESVFPMSNYTFDVQTTNGTYQRPTSANAPSNEEITEYGFSDSEPNFFAAFSESPSSQFLNALDESSEDDSWRIGVAIDKSDEPIQPRLDSTPTPLPVSVVNQAEFNLFSNSSQSPVVVPNQGSARKGDDDRMLGLIAEQQQYDTMGVWENDPPLAKPQDSEPTLPSNTPLSMAPNPLFGSDFDDEVVVSPKLIVTATNGSRPTASQPTAVEHSASKSVPGESNSDYLVRMQQFAEALTTVTKTESNTHAATNSANVHAPRTVNAQQPVQLANPLAETLWSIDVNTNLSANGQVEDAIEDIVSQLNFSALSVEPFSVEQIPLNASPKGIPEDSIRRGQNDEVYLMHRPNVLDQHLAVEDFDDDRDLLIVEEEVPVSSRMLDNTISEHPAQKTTSYSQLFARLRK